MAEYTLGIKAMSTDNMHKPIFETVFLIIALLLANY